MLAVLKIDGLGRSGHINKVKAGQSALKIEKCLCHTGLLSDGPITFFILSLGPKRQQDYALARFLTKEDIIRLISQQPHFL